MGHEWAPPNENERLTSVLHAGFVRVNNGHEKTDYNTHTECPVSLQLTSTLLGIWNLAIYSSDSVARTTNKSCTCVDGLYAFYIKVLSENQQKTYSKLRKARI